MVAFQRSEPSMWYQRRECALYGHDLLQAFSTLRSYVPAVKAKREGIAGDSEPSKSGVKHLA